MPRKPKSTRKPTAARHELFRRIDAEQRAASVLSQSFGIESQECAPPIDVVIMQRLRAGLNFDWDLYGACFQRGLLSARLGEALYMACFLSSTLPFARAAQHQTGVPASVLIAEAFQISSAYFDGVRFQWGGRMGRAVNDLFNTGAAQPSIKDAFMARAYSLVKDTRFQPVLRAAGDPARYIEQVTLWSAPEHNAELVNTITTHSLIECDRIKAF